MKPTLKSLKDQVIVITGASSGIGLTTAEMAAEQGAAVVLGARSVDELNDVASRIRRNGGRAAAVDVDVADESQVRRLAERAVQEFGRIDTWVNNAGQGMYGKLVDQSMADKRRLFDINFWGTVYGCAAAVPHLKASGGAIINIGSEVSEITAPLQVIYSATKHAMKAYTEGLRMELEHDGVPISVTLIEPGPIDTPYPQHARNYMEREPKAAGAAYPPEEVARAVLTCAETPIPEVIVGGMPRLQIAMHTIAPRLTELWSERTMFKGQKSDRMPFSGDSLDAPSGEDYGIRHGRHTDARRRFSVYTRAALSDVGRAAPLMAVGLAVAVAVAASRR